MTALLDAECHRILLDGTHRRRYAAGEMIIDEGDLSNSLYWLAHGTAAVRLNDYRGQGVTLSYIHEGEFFGEMGLTPGTDTRTAMIEATEDCLVVELSYARFRALAAANDGLWLALVGQISARLRDTNRRLVDTGLLRVPDRTLEALRTIAREQAPDGGEVRIRVTREELGNLVGCTREVAGRALKQLAAQGQVRLDGRAVIVRLPPETV